MRRFLAGVLLVTVATVHAELEGINPARAIHVQVNTNNIAGVYSNLLSSAGVSNRVSLQTVLESFLLGNTMHAQNLDVTKGLTVSNSASVGGTMTVTSNLVASGNVTGNTGTFTRVNGSAIYATDIYVDNLTSSNTAADVARTYTYQLTGTFSVASAVASETNFYAATQSIGQLHVGMFLTNAAVFQAATKILSVDYGTRYVTVDKSVSNASSVSCSFSATGTIAHVVPSGFSRCRIIVTGGGGSGGADTSGDAGAGGGAGGTSIGYWMLTPGTTYTVTVGSGGASKTSEGSGSSGGTSSFGALQTATGGAGGSYQVGTDPISDGGAGGMGTGGQILLRGDAGTDGGGNRGGYGGASFWGGGGPGGDDTFTAAQKAGLKGSGGGGGAVGENSGAGGSGIVVVEYY